MSMFVKLSIIVLSMIFILHLMGVQTGAESVLSDFGLIGEGGTISLSVFLTALFLIYASAVGIGIAVGFWTGAPTESIVIMTSIASIVVLTGAISSMISKAGGFSSWVAIPLVGFITILGIAYIYSTIDFVFNR